MKVTESKVRKLNISGLERMDSLNVFIEDFHLGAGRITIEQCGDSWSYYWSHMGEQRLTGFILSCDHDYIMNKLSPGIRKDELDDCLERIEELLKKEIVSQRRETGFTRKEARELWDRCEDLDDDVRDNNNELYYTILGDEWWFCLPQKPNYDYTHLKKVVDSVKEALKEVGAGK